MSTKRHAVDIIRASTELGSRGQETTETSTVASDVPCSIEPLRGRELELARQTVADATHRVTMYADDSWNLTSKDWVMFGTRKLNIGYIHDPEEIGLEVTLTCGEDV